MSSFYPNLIFTLFCAMWNNWFHIFQIYFIFGSKRCPALNICCALSVGIESWEKGPRSYPPPHWVCLSHSLSSLRSKMGSSPWVTTLFVAILISSAHSFYLPGVAPRDFQTVRYLTWTNAMSALLTLCFLSPQSKIFRLLGNLVVLCHGFACMIFGFDLSKSRSGSMVFMSPLLAEQI